MLIIEQSFTSLIAGIFIHNASPAINPDEDNLADDDDEAFDDEMQDEEDEYQQRSNDNEMEAGDEDHLPDDDLQ